MTKIESESRVAVFLDLYKNLEAHIKEAYPDADERHLVSWLANRHEFKSTRNEIDYCRQVRNLLSHKATVNGEYAVEPSEGMVDLLRSLLEKIANPPRAHHIMTPFEAVTFRAENDAVKPALTEMIEKRYSHIPILEDKRVRGVFSESTLLAHLLKEGPVEVEGMTFADLSALLPIDAHASESFCFVGKDALVTQLSDQIELASRKQDRIGMMFVTHSGRPDERLLGIITAWDVAAAL